MKKLLSKIMLVLSTIMLSITSVNAADIGMYINNTYVVRDLETVGSFDMVPILDIAGELGFNSDFDGQYISIHNDEQAFLFEMGSASVYDKDGKWFGLDIVPQYINGHVMIPANFLVNVLSATYTWDNVTNSIFINSNDTYTWLINTPEYISSKNAKAIQRYNNYSNNTSSVYSDNTSQTVYITKTGSKYHRSGCRYLRQSKIAIDKSSAISQGYDPCSVCNP